MGRWLQTSVFVRADTEDKARELAAIEAARRSDNFTITKATKMSRSGWRVTFDMERRDVAGAQW